MNLRGVIVVLALAAGLARTQDNPALEIQGVVTEVGLKLGVAGAEVTLYEFVRDPERYRVVFATAATDTRGEFRFHPVRFGAYYVEVKKQGYFATMSWDGPTAALPETTGTNVNVSADHPSQAVRLVLMRPGQLTGHAIDDEGKPVPMLIQIAPAGAARPNWQPIGGTNRDGSFTSQKLIPGDYLVKVGGAGESVTVVPKFSEEDLKVVDQGPETVYWPGVPDERSATPVHVSPGSFADLGTVRVRKTPSYRARVVMNGCEPDDRPGLRVTRSDGHSMMMLTGGVPSFGVPLSMNCGDFEVRGLNPGSYSFAISSRRSWAETAVEITDRNVEITLTLSPPLDIPGRFVVPEGVPLPPLDKVKLTGATQIHADGSFLIKGVSALNSRISLSGLSTKYYVKEFRLDGQSAPSDVLALRQGSRLEIVLDDKPAAISGLVVDRDKPFSQPLVFVTKWPLTDAGATRITGDSDGRFQIAGLSPGEYRVLAMPSTELPDGQQVTDAMLSELWSGAEKVTLERGGSQSVAVKLSDPLR